MVAMPSRVVDDLWHEVILDTRWYAELCARGFGRILHHTPEGAMAPDAVRLLHGAATALTWRLAGAEQRVSPYGPHVPLLFALDGWLSIEGGTRWEATCGPAPGPAATSGPCGFAEDARRCAVHEVVPWLGPPSRRRAGSRSAAGGAYAGTSCAATTGCASGDGGGSSCGSSGCGGGGCSS